MKKLGKRYLSLILSVVLCFTTFMSVMVIDAQDYKVPGPKLTYSFDKASGTLTVSGTGDMYDFWDSSLRGRVPWNDIKDSITKVLQESVNTLFIIAQILPRYHFLQRLKKSEATVLQADTLAITELLTVRFVIAFHLPILIFLRVCKK